MPRHRLREIIGSLRFRLTLWNMTTFLAMILFTLWAVREGLRYTLRREADEQLMEDANEARLIFESLFPHDLDQIKAELNLKATTHTHRGFYARLYDQNQKLLWTSSNAPQQIFPEQLLNIHDKPISYEQFRLINTTPRKPGIPKWTIRVATSFNPLEGDVGRLTQSMIWVGACILVISPLGGYWLAGRATKPLADIISTTGRLHPDKLVERLPIRGTGDELDKLSRTINGFLDRIAKYINDNREFTANAAHELRSPLTAIQSSIEVSLNSDRSPEQYKELICDILDECSDLRVLVNQLLLLAESDAGLLHIEKDPFDLRQVVERALDMFQGVAETRSIQLNMACHQPVFVRGDSGRLRQVINNLIDNAIKFSPNATQVNISLDMDSEAQQAVFKVSDQGVGIDENDKPHLFERFFRGDKARQRDLQTKGTGLGLSICQAIVLAHRGAISVDNNPAIGCTFTVRLPA
ncbi:MAG: ATP-binding protein [Planctomycetota bacterium]